MSHSKAVVKVGEEAFEPRILALTCNWCAYAGADLAGTSRVQYPTNVRIVRLMCSARINPVFVLEALRSGVDGVLVGGCHPGDCHYISGNFKTQRRIALLKRLLDQLGVEPERLRLEWISASEGEKFAKVIKEMVADLKRIGPSPLRRE